MTDQQSLIPPVVWAQRNAVVFLTICVEDCKAPDIKIEPQQIIFHGVSGLQKKVFDVTIPLYAVIEPENSTTFNTGRYIELVLQKLPGETKYWPYLTKEKKKYHWLKVDFKKWQDEEDSEDESGAIPGSPVGADEGNLDDMLSMMGGTGGAGLGAGIGAGLAAGLGGGPGGVKYGNLEGDYNEPSDDDSDDGELPDLDDVTAGAAGKAKEKTEEDEMPGLEEVKPAKTA